MNLEKFERYPLTFGPTAIEHLPRMSEALGGKVEIYAKREDCNSGLATGGNKLRKLEYIVPDAIASNADTLVSIGGVQSNHTRMVAAVAAKIGMKCRLVQESWVPHEDAVYDRVGNILMTRLMGADSRIVDESFDIGIRLYRVWWPCPGSRCSSASTDLHGANHLGAAVPSAAGWRDCFRRADARYHRCGCSGRNTHAADDNGADT